MKIREPFRVAGTVNLFMKFYPEGHPEIGFFDSAEVNFCKPPTEESLFMLLARTGMQYEEYLHIHMEGEYISKEEYLAAACKSQAKQMPRISAGYLCITEKS